LGSVPGTAGAARPSDALWSRRPSGAAFAEAAIAVEIEGVVAAMGHRRRRFHTAELDDLIPAAEP
jgi:hypothetical protein